jgi:NAD(P)-dependent dehydrogenase (short-subunit alcohol dehydrogenase family)
MTDQDWNIVYETHMRGMYKVCKAAWSFMQKEKWGRIVTTSSVAGLIGK